MSIEVSGGAGGMGATYQDLLAHAGVLDRAGDEVRRWSDDVGTVAVDESVLASALLCPAEAAAVAVAVGTATLALVGVSTALEGSALVLQATVETYAFLDEAQQAALDALAVVGGFALGTALPGLALLGVGVVASNPALAAALVWTATQHPELLDPLLRPVFESPWITEAIAKSMPWTVQGAAFQVMGGGVLGLVGMGLLTGGRWPTWDYETAIGGLVTAGGRAGWFQDGGDFTVVEADVIGAAPPGSVADIFAQQTALGAEGNEGQIQITRVVDAHGAVSFIVQVPGTQDWAPWRSDNPVDLTSNVTLMNDEQTVLQRTIAEAMDAAGIGPDDPVMLTGHSQGGIAAAAMATDPAFTARYDVQSVVTGGSPIARFDIPDDITVLALEHDQDMVPMLDGYENPDRPNWVTVERDLSGTDVPPHAVAAHGTTVYEDTGAQVDGSTDPSVQQWKVDNARFFPQGGTATVERYEITPVSP